MKGGTYVTYVLYRKISLHKLRTYCCTYGAYNGSHSRGTAIDNKMFWKPDSDEYYRQMLRGKIFAKSFIAFLVLNKLSARSNYFIVIKYKYF